MADLAEPSGNANPAIEQSPTSPRKRRRRAPTTGAADDCFACQENQLKCNRRRPYCTQCLDQGKDCSGYKTTLTWGLGVASRGKLRGLSLPVAKSRKVEANSDAKTESKTKGVGSHLTKLGPMRSDSQQSHQNPTVGSPNVGSNSSSATATTTTFNFVNIDPASTSATASPMRPPPSANWHASAAQTKLEQNRRGLKRARRHSLQPLQVPSVNSFRELGGVPMTASAIGGYGAHAYESSVQCSPMTPIFPSYHAISPTFKDLVPQFTMIHNPGDIGSIANHEGPNWQRGSISSSLSSDQSSRDYCEDDMFYADPVVSNTLDDLLSGQQAVQDIPNMVAPAAEETCSVSSDEGSLHQKKSLDLVPDNSGAHPLPSLALSLPSSAIGKSPSMKFLIEYYEKVISPVIVAFDGPTNPYRTHILQLALRSETLQHAIAALSASNLRIRRGQDASSCTRHRMTDSTYSNSVRQSAMAHTLLDGGTDQLPQTSPYEPSSEELFHKSASIKALNQQLADPNRRLDDSVLATLLMLCLYHICDTGVGKFKTQFAGVKKILAMRDNAAGIDSKATNWLTIMFTWFDAMTATVNNREGQFMDDETEWSAFNGDKWALENLAGCDAKLFKILARLGRLNLLSQNKSVAESRRPNSPLGLQSVPSKSKPQDFYSMSHNRYDGNGWSKFLGGDDTRMGERGSRSQFWKEWSDVRRELQEWNLGSPNTLNPAAKRGDWQDLSHISESFRYSALLYTERLAYPQLPSSHPNFQNLVTQALFHISTVKSDVFLLWPLFITGTECVSEEGRHLIRERCLSIQKDSGFFNNMSGLELLERVWRDDATIEGLGIGTGATMGTGEWASTESHGFKWRKAMEKVDGEYIVV